ncbi:hypothetical protein NKI41_32345 [Mesorhizobium sp. M0601]|uniref:hypothetical protein n=1 Tax=Mesorhizobium sp. M0601 TaxID=2956969 RepID=UPI0033396FFD
MSSSKLCSPNSSACRARCISRPGYMANLGIIPAGRSCDIIFSDRLNHACIIDGAQLSGAEFRI